MVRAYEPLLVIPGSEYGVILATRLAEDLKLPGNPYANIEKFTSKVAMHNALKEYGVRYIKGKLVNSLEEAIEYYHEAKMDTCVIKPTRGAGSSSVHLCNNEEEMIEAVKQEFNAVNLLGEKNQLLLQERINGIEYIVNTVSREGKHRLSSIWRYKKKCVQGGGHLLIPEKTYWHLPCKMESIDVLCEAKGIILEAPVSGSGNTIVCTIP